MVKTLRGGQAPLAPQAPTALKMFLIKLHAFNVNENGGVCLYLQDVMESVLVKIQTFSRNGGDGVYDGACFYLHDVVDCS